ncbi:MAG: efflux RND transporter permease subunit [Pirellulaceae bacterium]|nr:efflux RND transporter permease subunit [Pirellulaceae bacterium]
MNKAPGLETHSNQPAAHASNDFLTNIVRIFLESHLSIILIVLSLIIGIAALWITPREEDPQIVVPLADVYVSFPGHTAAEVEQLVASPLERMLYQIDGVEYVYSMSRDDSAIITVRFYVGQDRERSLVKLFKKLNENAQAIPPGVSSWVMQPVEIDDVPIVTFALTGADNNSHSLRRVGEELIERLAVVPKVSRAYLVGGQPRTISVQLEPDRLLAHKMGISEVRNAVAMSNVASPSSSVGRLDQEFQVAVQPHLTSVTDVENLVVGVFEDRPVFLKDVAKVLDGPDEVTDYVRHGWGAANSFQKHESTPGWLVGSKHGESAEPSQAGLDESTPAVTIAISKQKGANAVQVAEAVIQEANRIREEILPDDVELIVTRNNGIVANEKVNELIEALGVAIVIVVLLLTFGLGWREALIVSIAVPVVFGLTLAVNLLFGYTINRVTLFALILALGLLVDDPIVDVENIARHFEHRKKATRQIVLDAVAEIRPPLISATLAVIVSFLPMFFITGMMGPYMSPMALNVPVAMVMSMFVAFTITPWLSYHILTWGTKLHQKPDSEPSTARNAAEPEQTHADAYDPIVVQQSLLYKFFRPLMLPLLKTRLRAVVFLVFMGGLTVAAMSLGALRMVPLKMLPFDNKNEILFLLDMPEGTTLERTDAVIRRVETVLASQPEVINYVSTVGASGPIDFNGMVRHYYLRSKPFQAEVRANFVGKKNRSQQSHGIGLRLRDELEALANSENAKIQIVELPPGPPVLASLVAEVYGSDQSEYRDILNSAATVVDRMRREPGVTEVDDVREADVPRLVFEPDQEKAALSGISVTDIANSIQLALSSDRENVLRVEGERNPLRLAFRLPRDLRSSQEDLSQLSFKNSRGQLVQLRELGSWRTETVSQTIYHKNLKRVGYVFAECVGRPPADCVIDILSDQLPNGPNFVEDAVPRSLDYRSFLFNGSGIDWRVTDGMQVSFAGEGEWKITLDVFRDLGLAFAAAMLMIYIILVAQMGSFLVPIVVMLAIPLTALGVMPGFYLLNAVAGQTVGGYADPVYFTATAMIGMIALSGIVTRDSIILVDFMQQSVARGRPLFDAILESRVVRLRPILLTAGAALLSAIPITLDPIFSGLGWSLIFGLIASTLFTLFVIPVTYWLLYAETKSR